MTRKLTKLHIDEISLVPSAANPGARVMIYKAARPPTRISPQRQRFQDLFSQIDF